MTTPTTLVEFVQQEKDRYGQQKSDAQSELSAAQADLIKVKDLLRTDTAALAVTAGTIAAARAKLATASVPSEVAALNEQIRDLIIQQRQKQGTILDEQDEVSAAQARADAAGGTLARASAKLADAQATLASATADAKKRQDLKDALATATYTQIKADAIAALAAGAIVSDAEAELKKSFPVELMTIAEKRRDTRASRVADLKAALVETEDAYGTVAAKAASDGAVVEAAILFQRAESKARDYLATAKLNYDRSFSVMKSLQDIKNSSGTLPDVLTPREQADAKADSNRQGAELQAESIDDDRKKLFKAYRALDETVATKLADPNFDIDTLASDTGIADKRKAVNDAQDALDLEKKNFAAGGKELLLNQWEVIVPDAAWSVLLDYEIAKAALTALTSIDPSALVTNLTGAEKDYAAALDAAAKVQRRVEALKDAIAIRRQRLADTTAALPARLPSAVRGDSD